jgi:methanogenic corrinoid protein MtbC1
MATLVERLTDTIDWAAGTVDWNAGETSLPDVRSPARFRLPATGDASARTLRHRRAALLGRVVEAEILPRLVLAQRAAADRAKTLAAAPLATGHDVNHLVRLALTRDPAEAVTFVGSMRLRGVPAEALYLETLAGAARELHDVWLEDRCDFARVTLAMGCLQQVLRALSCDFQATATTRAEPASALLLPAPGEQHTMGLLMLGEFFRRSGWRVAGGPVSAGVDAAHLAHDAWFDVAAFSIGSVRLLDALASCIRRVRRTSRNRGLAVMVGGPLFQLRPDLVGRVGADFAAASAPDAVLEAGRLAAMRAAAE